MSFTLLALRASRYSPSILNRLHSSSPISSRFLLSSYRWTTVSPPELQKPKAAATGTQSELIHPPRSPVGGARVHFPNPDDAIEVSADGFRSEELKNGPLRLRSKTGNCLLTSPPLPILLPVSIGQSLQISTQLTPKGYSTYTAEGLDISLAKIIRGKKATNVFWVEIVPGVLRASTYFRLMIKHIYMLLREHKQKGTAHGNLTTENVRYGVYNFEKPLLINHLDGCTDVSVDFLALRGIMKEIFDVSGNRAMDTETSAFMSFLSSAKAGNKHYWLMNAIEREKFFCDVGLRCREDLKGLFANVKAPMQIPLAGTVSAYCHEFVKPKDWYRGIRGGWHKLDLDQAIWETRNYYVQYGDNKSKRTTVTIYHAELDHFKYYPQLLPAIYEEMEKKNVTYLL